MPGILSFFNGCSFMFRLLYKVILTCLAGLFIVWAGEAALGMFGQRKLFYEEGQEELYDFWMPRMCLEQGYVGHPEQYKGFVEVQSGKGIEIDECDVGRSTLYTHGIETKFITGWRDRVYPLFGILALKPFLATRFGGYLWSVIAGLVFLASLCLIAESWRTLFGLALLSPLKLVLLSHGANQAIGNLSFLGILLLRTVKNAQTCISSTR